MKRILTEDEKKYLQKVCRYMGSLGMTEATIEIDMEDGIYESEDINWNEITTFSNNYRADIPEGLTPILKKISDFIYSQELVNTPDVDSLNYQRLEFSVSCDSREIAVYHDFGYYDIGDSQGTFWNFTDDQEELQPLFESLEAEGLDDEEELILRYNGGGDSGFIESSFEEGGSVPGIIEDWCYSKLESIHGGWEINEGSEGEFVFDIVKKEINLSHQYNVEENERNTLWEEKF